MTNEREALPPTWEARADALDGSFNDAARAYRTAARELRAALSQPSPAVPEDFWSHQSSWRKAIATRAEQDDSGYWSHELRAFDRAYAELTAAPPPAEPAQPALHVCSRHDFDFVADPKVGCPKCNAEQPTTQAGALCEDEGCPHHGTAHICVSSSDNSTPTTEQPTPCAGENCGTTTAQHSRECIAEAGRIQGWTPEPDVSAAHGKGVA